MLGEAAQIKKIGVKFQSVAGAFGEPFPGCLTRDNAGEKQVIVRIQHEDALFSFLRVGWLYFTQNERSEGCENQKDQETRSGDNPRDMQ